MIFQIRPAFAYGGAAMAFSPRPPAKKKEYEKAIAQLESLRALEPGQARFFPEAGKPENKIWQSMGIIKTLKFEDKADVAEYFSKITPLNEEDRKFVYKVLCLTGPCLMARRLEEDAGLAPDKFRKKNGEYNSRGNNCRHYMFKQIYGIYKNSLPPEFLEKAGKIKNGRPENLDWKGPRQMLRKFEAGIGGLDEMLADRISEGHAAGFVKIKIKDDSKIGESLQPGDIVWVSLSPNPNSTSAHVGGYTGRNFKGKKREVKIPIVNIAKPLVASEYSDFVKRTRRRGGEVYIMRWAGEIAVQSETKKSEPDMKLAEIQFKHAEKDALGFRAARTFGSRHE